MARAITRAPGMAMGEAALSSPSPPLGSSSAFLGGSVSDLQVNLPTLPSSLSLTSSHLNFLEEVMTLKAPETFSKDETEALKRRKKKELVNLL